MKEDKPYPWRGNLAGLIARVQELDRQGHTLHSEAMRKSREPEHRALYNEAQHKHKRKWSLILEQAGLQQHAKQTMREYAWRGKPDLIIARVQELQQQGIPVNSAAMQHSPEHEHRALLTQAQHKHGMKWSRVLAQARLQQHAKHGIFPWRGKPDAIIARVKELQQQGQDVKAGAMQYSGEHEHRALFKEASERHAMTWSQVLAKAGLAHLIKQEQHVTTEAKVAALRRLLRPRK